jgi:pyruvate/2-oxoglutarate dehydrogenase complex dihydrolipoamide acyltransferase (E2) component
MASSFKLPDLGEGLTEGEVARWLVAEGQEIGEDDPLVEIQTDKATVEIPSPYAGTVLRILVAEGEIAPVGTELVVIGAPGDEAGGNVSQAPESASAAAAGTKAPSDTVSQGQSAASSEIAAAATAGGRVQATPVVRRIAQELGVELSAVAGSGPGGRVTEDDVRAAAGDGTSTEGRREPLRGVRRVIAEHMARAHREVPPVTWVEECDFEDLALDLLLPTVVKACAHALADFPELNARFEGDAIVYLDRYDIGVAVQTDDGLVVPVVRGAGEKPIAELSDEIAALAERARSHSLAADELRGSTFTVTSAGKLAGLFQTPIVNHPEVAILSIGRVAPRPVVRDGEVVVRRTGMIAITFDHRVVDGARAAAFGLAVIDRLQSGERQRA